MTILQLKYVVAISTSVSMREASGKLYVSQPALSATIRDLEEELGIRIFDRTNKGIKLTEEGNEFLGFAKQAVSQYELVEHKYLNAGDGKDYYTISTQHYVFAIHAFVNAVEKRNAGSFSYLIQETRTDKVLQNVRDYKSEIGVLAYTGGNKNIINKLFREYELDFHPLMVCDTYAYLSKSHPLAHKKELSVEELKEYPCVTFDQTNATEFYLSEEALSGYEFQKIIRSNDRATSCEIITMLNGFAIGTGMMIDSNALKDVFVSIKLKEEDPLTIGYIVKKKHLLSDFGELYVQELEKYKTQI
ncbi:MAG: LysR family transcriptional regulator [Acetatifactor sp.]|nr:LysR family transcriptional regulator [Acetatifactor sp.]